MMRRLLPCLAVLAAACPLVAAPALAQDDFKMSPLVSGVYACEGADLGDSYPMFALTDDSAFNLEEGPGDLMMYDGVSGILQLGMMGSPAAMYERTGPEEFRLLRDGGATPAETLCTMVPGKDPNSPPW